MAAFRPPLEITIKECICIFDTPSSFLLNTETRRHRVLLFEKEKLCVFVSLCSYNE